ncbi:hypothetical protein ALP35_00591 [Pseudomonas savastanoi pv. glycinea]|nr:hypothetical protein ALP35_00591 [Pseudomonas savastanoi pv. glycinea]
MFGAGDAGVDEFFGQYRVERFGQDQGGVGEFRALGFVYGHGVHGFYLIEAARQDEAHAIAAVVARERDT